jgi:hypothetical protein
VQQRASHAACIGCARGELVPLRARTRIKSAASEDLPLCRRVANRRAWAQLLAHLARFAQTLIIEVTDPPGLASRVRLGLCLSLPACQSCSIEGSIHARQSVQ